MRKLLYGPTSECVQPLVQLAACLPRKTLVLWALDCAIPYLMLFEGSCPHDDRPRQMLAQADRWARGEIKMPEAKKAILAAHKAATAAADFPAAQAAARAAAQAASTIHVKTHAMGLVYYGLTAIAYTPPKNTANARVDTECTRLYQRMCYWQQNAGNTNRPWASFLLRDDD